MSSFVNDLMVLSFAWLLNDILIGICAIVGSIFFLGFIDQYIYEDREYWGFIAALFGITALLTFLHYVP